MSHHTKYKKKSMSQKAASILMTLGVYLIIDVATMAFISPVSAAISQDEVKHLIILEAEKSSNVSANLALAVAHVESRFNSNALSPKGAIGVMQIMPRTGRDVFGLTSKQLYDPRTNISAGITFLSQLIEQYEGRIDLALSHYNGGSAVSRNGQKRIIPYTRDYILKVLAAAQKYSVESNTLPEKAGLEALFEEPHFKEKLYPQILSDNRFGLSKIKIKERSFLSDLKQVDFWLHTAKATRDGNVNNVITSPSAHLIAQMTNNRQRFRNRLRQKQ